ncbi:MAG: extracellular solute-binding protein [Eubacterium sp.]|nr:extracellular solute-binding protein [Eubacterium sp.]
MKKRKFAGILLFCLFLTGCARTKNQDAEQTPDSRQQEENDSSDTKEQLTIWIDEDNEWFVRYYAAFYQRMKDTVQGTDKEDSYTNLDIALIPKNNLSAKQYQEELDKALENGEAPDILYMDACNGVNPLELIEAGKLAPLGEGITKRFGETLEYIDGTLEAGKKDGEYYVLPIRMECPIVFGVQKDLEAAGIQTDTRYRSLEEFLDALLAAHEKTGKMIFESTQAVDWLEQYYLPQDGAQELSEKLAKVRTHSGADESRLGAYEGLSNGKCLLGGCGVYDYKKLAANAYQFGEQKLAMLAVPDSSGSVCGLVTHAAAVNADSAYAKEAVKALLMFQNNFSNADFFSQDLPVIKYKDMSVFEASRSLLPFTQSTLALPIQGISRQAEEDFTMCFTQECTKISYVQEYGERDLSTHASGQEKKPVSICFSNTGDGEAYPAGRWLSSAADAYMQSQDDTYIQLLSTETMQSILPLYYQEMEVKKAAPDALLGPADRMVISGMDLGSGADFRKMLEDCADELDFLPDVLKGGIQYAGAAVGLPVQVQEYGAWVSRRALEQAGMAKDWKPANAEELTKGMEQLAKILPPSYVLYGNSELKALALFAEPDSLLIQQEDGSYRCSKESWTRVLALLKNWKDTQIALRASGQSEEKNKIMHMLANGETGMVLGCSDLSGYIDGTYGAAMTKEQQEDLVFLPLSPAANVNILFVSGNSDSAEEVFAFWKQALQHPDYAKSIRANSGIPVTEVSETVCQILPLQECKAQLNELWEALWEKELSEEELAEEYPLYDWAEE